MYALTYALQIELGISPVSQSFGPTTLSRLAALGDIGPSTSNKNIIGIIQCALWCKGYAGGGYAQYAFGSWDGTTGASVAQMRMDMGIANGSTVPAKMFKSLLTMDAYVRVSGGTDPIRAIERWMNGRYLSRSDYYIVPADGIYSRDVNRGLMYAIQYELGLADGTANGNFGPTTQQGLKDYGSFAQGGVESGRKLVSLFQAALTLNGYACSFSGSFDSNTAQQTVAFQSFSGLPTSGRSDYATWASLLTSTGDPSRAATGFDSNRKQTTSSLATLRGKGFAVALRYLSGDVNSASGKCISFDEPDLLFANGFSWVPLYQENNNDAKYFGSDLGFAQGQRAMSRARSIGLHAGTTIFFSVDFDATSDDINAVILKHFQGIKKAFDQSRSVTYKIGVYATRNVCTQLALANLTTASFVSDLSTGYSGNLGFPLPVNWHYDQIQNVGPSASGLGYDIDRDVVSTRANPAKSVVATPPLYDGTTPVGFDVNGYWNLVAAVYKGESGADATYVVTTDVSDIVLEWMQKSNPDYAKVPFTAYAPSRYVAEPSGPRHDALVLAAAALANDAPSVDFPYPSLRQFGDTAHFAVSTRGYTFWGSPSASDATVAPGDLGAWAFDLISLWNNYEHTRLARADKTLDVFTWFSENAGVGPASASRFAEADLRADCAAYILARRLNADGSTTLSEQVRILLLSCQADPGYLPRTFYDLRFGGAAGVAVQAGVSIWNPTSWPPTSNLAIDQFIDSDVRKPGDTQSTFDPPPAVRATEKADIAAGFEQALLRAARSWALR